MKSDRLTTALIVMAAAIIAAFIITPSHIRGAFAMQNKSTPIATTGVPAPMLYDSGDPVSLGYPCDASHMGIPFYNMTSGIARPIWVCNATSWVQAQPAISGATVSIGGSLLLLNSTVSGTATVAGAIPGENCIATRSDGALPPAGVIIDCAVTSANTVTVRLTALISATPSAVTYSVRVFQ